MTLDPSDHATLLEGLTVIRVHLKSEYCTLCHVLNSVRVQINTQFVAPLPVIMRLLPRCHGLCGCRSGTALVWLYHVRGDVLENQGGGLGQRSHAKNMGAKLHARFLTPRSARLQGPPYVVLSAVRRER